MSQNLSSVIFYCVISAVKSPCVHVTECMGEQAAVEEAHKLLHRLRDKLMPDVLPRSNIMEYHIGWDDTGVDW